MSESPSPELADLNRRLLHLTEAFERLNRAIVNDKCDAQESDCKRRCAEERDRAILALQIDRNRCLIDRAQAMVECRVNFLTDPAGSQRCQREVEEAHQRCIARIDAATAEAQDAYAACTDRCADEAFECRSQAALPDHEPPAPDLKEPDPSRPDFGKLPRPEPAPGPQPPRA